MKDEEPKRLLFTRKNSSVVELIILPDIFGQKHVGYIHKVFTDTEFRRRGYASELTKEAINRAKKEGCYKVFLLCDEKMVSFYEKIGMSRHQVGMEVRF